jgi:hypothetical protein
MKLNQGKIENKNILPPETDQKAQNKKELICIHIYTQSTNCFIQPH